MKQVCQNGHDPEKTMLNVEQDQIRQQVRDAYGAVARSDAACGCAAKEWHSLRSIDTCQGVGMV
jgi:hypothetical protein